MKTLRISVTQEDIAAATFQRGASPVWSSSEMCPIARALHRQGYPKAQVRSAAVLLEHEVRAALSLRAQQFTVKFDNHRKVRPMRFLLKVPE